MNVQVAIPRDAAEVQIQASGQVEGAITMTLLEVDKLQGSPTALRLIDVCYAIESGLKVQLRWEDKDNTLLLPLEGRGRLDLIPIGGIHNPRRDGWTGHVLLSTEGEGHFFLGLEFAKLKS